MKKLALGGLVLLAILSGCKKDTVSTTPLASLNLVNATVGVPAIKARFVPDASNPPYFAGISSTTSYGANTAFGVRADINYPLYVINSADTTKTIATANLGFGTGDIYTLYLAGQSTAVDTILRKEKIPGGFTDSVCAVRFINLSYNSSPIKITLASTPTADEAGTLAYKQQSDFKTYSATVANNTYSFQVRDAASNTVLATYSLTVPRFFACTLAWIGQTGGTGSNAPKIQRINNY